MTRLLTTLAAALLIGSALTAPAAPAVVRAASRPAAAATPPTTQEWLADFPKFIQAAGSRNWMVGRSSATCVTEQEAFDQAGLDAASQLRKFLRANLSAGGIFKAESDAWIKARVARELALGNLIVDRAVRKVHRPYGDIWSAAVLVDASADRLDPIVRDHQAWRAGRTATVASTGFSLLGLSLAILAIYAVMNALTKGYFRGRLRASAGLALCLGTLFLIWLARA